MSSSQISHTDTGPKHTKLSRTTQPVLVFPQELYSRWHSGLGVISSKQDHDEKFMMTSPRSPKLETKRKRHQCFCGGNQEPGEAKSCASTRRARSTSSHFSSAPLAIVCWIPFWPPPPPSQGVQDFHPRRPSSKMKGRAEHSELSCCYWSGPSGDQLPASLSSCNL